MVKGIGKKKMYAAAVAAVLMLAGGYYVGAELLKSPAADTTKGDGNGSDTSNPPTDSLTPGAGDNATDSTLPLPPDGNNSLPGDDGTVNTPPTEHIDPNIHISLLDYNGNFVYGVPNSFTVKSEQDGPNQPAVPTKITMMIRISNIDNGSVEVRTYPAGSDSRHVNLYGDGQGGVYGILVADWSTWDYTWTFEPDKATQFVQQVSVNVSAYGDFQVRIYAIHDDGDGTYDVVSNTGTMDFSLVKPVIAIDNYFTYPRQGDNITGGFNPTYSPTITLIVKVDRNGYVGPIHDVIFVSSSYYGPNTNPVYVPDVEPAVVNPSTIKMTSIGLVGGTVYELGSWTDGDSTEYIINIHGYSSWVNVQVESFYGELSVTCEGYFTSGY